MNVAVRSMSTRSVVVACVVTPEGKETKTFGTMRSELLELADYLVSKGCTHVAMESTGAYWKPIVRHEALCDREGMKGPLREAIAVVS